MKEEGEQVLIVSEKKFITYRYFNSWKPGRVLIFLFRTHQCILLVHKHCLDR